MGSVFEVAKLSAVALLGQRWSRIARAPQARWRMLKLRVPAWRARAVRAADFGPVEYFSTLVGIDGQTAMRWFIVLVACLLDPAAVMLLVAACA